MGVKPPNRFENLKRVATNIVATDRFGLRNVDVHTDTDNPGSLYVSYSDCLRAAPSVEESQIFNYNFLPTLQCANDRGALVDLVEFRKFVKSRRGWT